MSFEMGLLLGSLICAIYVFFRSGFRVDNGCVGVCFEFGKFVRDRNSQVRTYGPGLHWKKPWAQASVISLGERSFTLEENESPIEVLAADGTRLRVNARIRFRVRKEKVAAFLAEAKHPLEDLRGLFQLVLREEFARFLPSNGELSCYTALRLRMDELQKKILESMRDEAMNEFGLDVRAVDLLRIDPPEDMIDALNAVITAESEASALIARTDLQCQQRVLSAEKAVDIARAKASAVEEQIRTVGKELGSLSQAGVLSAYLERRRAEILGHSRRIYLRHSN